MRILLIYLTLEEGALKSLVEIPLALGYLKAYALKDKQLVSQIEIITKICSPKDDKEIIDTIKHRSINVVGFSCYVWNILDTLRLCKLIKYNFPKIKIILGGPEVTYTSKMIMERNSYIDFIVRGEGEVTFYELIKYLLEEKGNKIQTIEGVTYRRHNKIVLNKNRHLIKNLDEIPSPFSSGVMKFMNHKNRIFYEIGRGCPYKCKYCSQGSLPMRHFSLERIREDMECLSRHDKLTQILLLTQVFDVNLKWYQKLCNVLSKTIKNKELFVQMRADSINRENL